MRRFIVCLLFGALLGIVFSLSFAQQNQITQKSDPEIEVLKRQILALKSQLQTVENVKKMELAAKLAEAQAKLAEANIKLINAEFGKFERDLRDSNDGWLMRWNAFFLGVLAVIGVVLWFWVKSLIADKVEKNLTGFKKAIAQVNTLRDQLGLLEEEYTASVLENFIDSPLEYENFHSEQIKGLREAILLQVINDEARRLEIRYKAAEVLVNRESTQLVSPLLGFMNSVVDLDLEDGPDFGSEQYLYGLARLFGQIGTLDVYQGLSKFLNRLLRENPRHKDLFLTQTVFSLANIGLKLGIGDSISILRRAIPNLNPPLLEYEALGELAEYFDMFSEPDGIKEILNNHLKDEMLGFKTLQKSVEDKCLELLENHAPDFVEEWKAQTATVDTENEESS